MRPTHGHCPQCVEESAIDLDGNCLWCGSQTSVNGTGKSRGKTSKLNADQLVVIHRLCQERDLTLTEVSEQIWQRFGYRNSASCLASISTQLKKAGFPSLRRGRRPNKKLVRS